jgi:hypothetical protein
VKIYGTARHATDNTTLRMRTECWIADATDTKSKYETLNCFSTAPIVTRTLLNATFIPTLLYRLLLPHIRSYIIIIIIIIIITEGNRLKKLRQHKNAQLLLNVLRIIRQASAEPQGSGEPSVRNTEVGYVV